MSWQFYLLFEVDNYLKIVLIFVIINLIFGLEANIQQLDQKDLWMNLFCKHI